MGIEIERKFLVNSNDEFLQILKDAPFSEIQQSYLSLEPERSLRIRLRNEKAFITIKGKQKGISRAEFEYEIPFEDGLELIKMGSFSPIKKRRYLHEVGTLTWEIDVFQAQNEGLIIAEIELTTESQYFEKPSWLGKDVTAEHRYSNLNMYQNLVF